jgi:transcription elongation factor Elf1
MSKKSKREKCKITSTIKIFCPHCGALVEIPMQQAVNGQSIVCRQCNQEFQFGS